MSDATNPTIHAFGIFTEHFSHVSDLSACLAAEGERLGSAKFEPPAGIDPFAQMRVRPLHADRIEREDRSVLNDISVLILNAIDDAFTDDASIDDSRFLDVPLLIGSDGAEHDFSALAAVVRDCGTEDDVFAKLGGMRERVNPLEMLRSLSTNGAYHASKRLQLHGGAYPLRAASLSGLVALEESISLLKCGASREAIVIAAGNMRSLDSLATFDKLGLLTNGALKGGVPLSYGAACFLLSREKSQSSQLATLLGAKSLYMPDTAPGIESWTRLFSDCHSTIGVPNVAVLYSIGIPISDREEKAALLKVFGDIRTTAYKRIFGYTGKANTLLDIAAVLTDSSIQPGERVLIAGAGLGYGLGYVVLEKNANVFC